MENVQSNNVEEVSQASSVLSLDESKISSDQLMMYNDTKDFFKVRYVFWCLGMLGMAILYALRGNLSIAIVAMVNHTAISQYNLSAEFTNSAKEEPCDWVDEEMQDAEDGELNWDSTYQAFILSGFFYGYLVGQIPGGILTERFHGKLVFGLGLLVTAMLTIVSPFTLWVSGELFFVTRLLEGLAESVTTPALQYMITRWAPLNERNRFSGMFSGTFLGNILCKPLSGFLCSKDGAGEWALVFYVFGVVGVLWYLLWYCFVYDSPKEHPRITKEEKRYIETSLGNMEQKERLPTPWKALATCPGLWACYLMYFGTGWNLYTLFLGLPTYLDVILRYKILNNALISTTPYVGACVSSFILSASFDMLLSRGVISRLTGFKIVNAIGGIGPACAMLGIPLAGCDRTWITLLFAFNGICMGANYIAISTNLIALAPNYAGITYGVTNAMSNLSSILAPWAIGYITQNRTRYQWNIVFYISASISLSTYILYFILCRDKEQPWNNPQPPHDISVPTNETKDQAG